MLNCVVWQNCAWCGKTARSVAKLGVVWQNCSSDMAVSRRVYDKKMKVKYFMISKFLCYIIKMYSTERKKQSSDDSVKAGKCPGVTCEIRPLD